MLSSWEQFPICAYGNVGAINHNRPINVTNLFLSKPAINPLAEWTAARGSASEEAAEGREKRRFGKRQKNLSTKQKMVPDENFPREWKADLLEREREGAREKEKEKKVYSWLTLWTFQPAMKGNSALCKSWNFDVSAGFLSFLGKKLDPFLGWLGFPWGLKEGVAYLIVPLFPHSPFGWRCTDQGNRETMGLNFMAGIADLSLWINSQNSPGSRG